MENKKYVYVVYSTPPYECGDIYRVYENEDDAKKNVEELIKRYDDEGEYRFTYDKFEVE